MFSMLWQAVSILTGLELKLTHCQEGCDLRHRRASTDTLQIDEIHFLLLCMLDLLRVSPSQNVSILSNCLGGIDCTSSIPA